MNNLNISSSLALDFFLIKGVEVVQVLINTRTFSFPIFLFFRSTIETTTKI